jgi:uncharacterized Tic20 family protein
MTTGQFIKEQRLKKGMTQDDLAAKTDLSTRSIQRIENDEVDARAYTLQTIALALDIDFDTLNSINKQDQELKKSNSVSIWLPLLHLSGLFTLLLPPLFIWFLRADEVKGIRAHAINVINFQLNMLICIIPCGLLAILIFPIMILIGLSIFSSVVIIINTIKVFNNQEYKYPLMFKILVP